MYAENEPAIKVNEAVLNDLRGGFCIIETNNKISENCKYLLALIQAAQNQKETDTGGYAKAKLSFKSNVNS